MQMGCKSPACAPVTGPVGQQPEGTGVLMAADFDSRDGCYGEFLAWQAAGAAAEQQERQHSKDIWQDQWAMQLLQSGEVPAGLDRKEKGRVAHRARLYSWQDGALYRRLPDGSLRKVPEPGDRVELVQRIHEQCGHYGVKRTSFMVAASHWWRTLHADVEEVVRRCAVCDRVRATFDSQQAELQPLPIEPMFYRWGFDLAGEFPVTAKGHKWVMIAVEHFSKHIELLPLADKTPEETAAAAAQILCRFGAPAELVTDGGGEWGGKFHELLEFCFVDHRVTSPFHPQANGLAERVVQVVKRSLRKLCETKQTTQWDQQLPWVALGYRCSKQSSTGFTPYELLYARQPVFPSQLQQKLEEPIDFDNADAAADSVLRRAKLLAERIPVAVGNLRAAQHRDTLRYQQLRSKGYLPRVAEFKAGDFVYLKRPKVGSTLVIKARPAILRVKEVKDSGVVVLQDKAGREVRQQVSQLALCHLPDIDAVIDRSLQGEDLSAECTVCGSPDDEHVFMFCDHCNSGWHTYCCTPPLAEVPAGHFLCERCRAEGVTLQDVLLAEQQGEQLGQAGQGVDLFPLADKRRRDERAEKLHGRLVTKQLRRGRLWGRVHFKGALARPRYFRVAYADGSEEDGLTYTRLTKGKGYTLKDEGALPPAGVVVPTAGDIPVQ